jgi:acyl transferase domain-containing protein
VPALADKVSNVRVVLESTPLKAPVPGKALLAGVNSFALRGLAYHVLLEAPPAAGTTPKAQSPSWRTVRLGAQTMEELSAQILRSQDDAVALFERAGHMGWSARDQVRLAIVADGQETLAKKLKLAAEQTGNASSRTVLEEQGVFCREVTAGPLRVAWMFSGQGSQYAGMLRELVRQRR